MPSLPFPPNSECTGGLTWPERLDECASVADVVDVVRVFMARFDPDEIASLPPGCRPGKIVDADDVSALAVDLMRQTCRDGEPRELLHKLAAVFAHASGRIAELSNRSNDAEEARLDSA
jgi:hypothetical protein